MATPTNVKLINTSDEYKEVLRPMIERLFRMMNDSPITRGDLASKSFDPREVYGQIFKHFVIRCDGDDVNDFYKSSGWILLTDLINEVHPTSSSRLASSLNHLNAWRREEIEKVFTVTQVNDAIGSISDEQGVNCLLSVDVYEIVQRHHRKKIFRALTWELEERTKPDNGKSRLADKFRVMRTYGFGPFVGDFYTEDYWAMVTDIHYLFEMYGMYVDEININPDEITILPYSK